MKHYWIIICILNKITPKFNNFYFRFNDGMRDQFHFGFHFIIWHWCGRININRNYYNKKFIINKSIHWLG